MTPARPDQDVRTVLETAGRSTTAEEYRRGETVFVQGDPAHSVWHILDGGITLSVRSRDGREAIVSMLGPGDFFGEGAMTDRSARCGTATATTLTHVLAVDKTEMTVLLHERHDLSDPFIANMVSRNVDLEADLIHELFQPCESLTPGDSI